MRITLETKQNINNANLTQLVSLAKSVMDKVITGETTGILSRPTTSKELVEFDNTVGEIVMNKLRNRLGV